MELDILKELNYQKYILDKYYQKKDLNQYNLIKINDIYPNFNWEIYKELNPYLYIIGLKTEIEYIHNYLLEGRYIGRIFNYEQKKDFSFHVLLATIGKKSIYNILSMLKDQLNKIDYLTIVFDGKNNSEMAKDILKYVIDFKCKVNIIIEDENLGYWGHGIRNKYKDLEGDFCFHIDDDDILSLIHISEPTRPY